MGISDLPAVQLFKSIVDVHDRTNQELLSQLKDLEAQHVEMKKNPFYSEAKFSLRVDRIIELNNQIQKNLMQEIDHAKKALDNIEQEIVLDE